MTEDAVDFQRPMNQERTPRVAPVSVRFRDQATGQWIVGLSEPKIDPNHLRISLAVRAYAPCQYQGTKLHQIMKDWRAAGITTDSDDADVDTRCPFCGAQRELTAERIGPANLFTNAFARLTQAGLFGITTLVTDTGGIGRTITKTMDGGIASLLMCVGTGTTPAAVTDLDMQGQTESQVAVTVNAVAGGGLVGTFTATATVTATAARVYTEIGIKAVTSTSGFVFLLTHDIIAPVPVANTGSASIIYIINNE